MNFRSKIILSIFFSLVSGFLTGFILPNYLKISKGNSNFFSKKFKSICKEIKYPSSASIPLTSGGLCPEFLNITGNKYLISEKQNTPIKKFTSIVKHKKVKKFAIEVKDPSNHMRILLYDLPKISMLTGNNQCPALKKFEFQWKPPFEPSDDPMTFPLCPGAQIYGKGEDECTLIEVTISGTQPPQTGGGCRSPANFRNLTLKKDENRGFLINLSELDSPIHIFKIPSIRTILWNKTTLSMRLRNAFIITIDANSFSLQELVDLINEIYYSKIPLADFLYVKEWEISASD